MNASRADLVLSGRQCTTRIGLIKTALATVGAIFCLLLPMNLLVGLSARDSVVLAAVVAGQSLSGCLLYSRIHRKDVCLPELIGFSLVIGTLVCTLTAVLLSGIIPLAIALFLPSVLSLLLILSSRQSFTAAVIPPKAAFLAIPLGLGLLSSAYFWKQNPLSWDGWWQLYGDLIFHEGIAKSIAANGLDNLNWLNGYGIGYHWFGDAWIGFTDEVSSSQHFAVSSRLILTVSYLACACLAWAWARRMSSSSLAPLFATTLVLIAGMTGAAYRNTYSVIGALYSPTHTFALMSLLALSILLLYPDRARPKISYLLVILLLAVGVAGGRITQVVVVVGATVGLFGYLYVSKTITKGRLISIGFMSIGLVVGLLIAIRPWAHIIRNNKFVFEPNSQFGAMLGFVPANSSFANLLSVPAVLLAVAAGWSGLIWFARTHPLPASVYWMTGGATAGFSAVFLTYQDGFSHMTFLWSASAIALVGSGVGVAEAFKFARDHAPRSAFAVTTALCLVSGVSAGVLGVVASQSSPGIRFEGLIRWSIPIAIWALAIVLGLLVFRRFGGSPARGIATYAGILILVSSSVGAGVGAGLLKWAEALPTYGVSTPLALEQTQLDAADWVRSNVPDSGLFVTNRLCPDPGDSAPECKSRWFLVSVLAGRPSLIEGYSDGTGVDISTETSENRWIRDRVLPIIEFTESPSLSSQTQLWNQNVRWVWIDRTISQRENWEPFAATIFQNSSTQILRLNTP